MTNKQLSMSLLKGGVPEFRVRDREFTKADIPALRQIAEEANAASRPARDDEVAVILERLFAHYWRPDITPALARTRLADWYEDLSGLPLRSLAAAARDWRTSAERFAPTPGQFLALARKYQAETYLARTAEKYIALLEEAPDR